MAGLFGGGGGGNSSKGGGGSSNDSRGKESLPTVLRDAPLWDRSKLTFEDWRTDTDFWRKIVENAGVSQSTVAGSIFFSVPEDDLQHHWQPCVVSWGHRCSLSIERT